MNCKICNTENVDNKHFFRAHKLTLAEYVTKHFPRKDLFSSEPIPFKNDFDRYQETDFLNRTNMRKWLESKDQETQKEYCVSLLKSRKSRKDLKYIPTQVELRSLISPTWVFLNKIFTDFEIVCQNLGFERRFSNNADFTNTNISKIFVDSREQSPLIFDKNIETSVVGLKYGDYAATDISPSIVVERKSLNDFCGTLSSRNIDRFHREIEKAAAANSYVVVIVETDLSKSLSFNYLPHMKNVKASPDFIFGNVRDTIQKYKNIQFLFADGRKEASRLTIKLLSNQNVAQNHDLQYLYDCNKL